MNVRFRKLGVDRGAGEVTLSAGATGLDLVRALNVHPETVLLARGDQIIPIDEPLHDGEEITITRIVTGG